MPAELHVSGSLDSFGADEDRIAIDFGLGLDKVAIGSRDLEFVEGLTIAGLESLAVSEADADLIAFHLHRFVERTGVGKVLHAVIFDEGPAGEAVADVVFVFGMDVTDVVDDVGGDSHAGVWDFKGGGLGLPDGGKLPVGVAGISPGSELDEVKGHGLVPEDSAPSVDEVFHFAGVAQAVLLDDIGFALIPDDSLDREIGDGGDHGVVHVARAF